MPNSRSSETYHEYATVHVAMDSSAGGSYYTNAILPRSIMKQHKVNKVFFSIRNTIEESDPQGMTVALEFKCGDEEWQEYKPTKKQILAGTASDEISDVEETFQPGCRMAIEDTGADVQWRAGVHWDDFTSGNLTFGFDW